jgi:hypothetical protein
MEKGEHEDMREERLTGADGGAGRAAVFSICSTASNAIATETTI